ncbi:MAG: GAF domain-containing sensor histidine kinase [Ardenticatenaceae bacterium]|nr:GAF domain-containing sensor histidine kinase [Ardenticatenaceae bacterium]MCB9445787.1 GAF domain-containing sensor histidine kinase [Ardenticatenaceae bacterium]
MRSIPLHFQLRRIRWLAPVIVLVLAALHQLLLQNLIDLFFPRWAEAARLLVYTFTGSIVAWMGLSWLATAVARRAEAEIGLRDAYDELDANHQKLLALHDLGQNVAAANNKQVVLELAARAPLHLTEASSSTVVTFDGENGSSRLKLDMAWGLSENYLKALRTQIDKGVLADRCRTCTVLHAHVDGDCPLFAGLQDQAHQEGIRSLVCLPIVQANERIAVLSAYFPSADGPPEDQIRLLNILGGVVAAALESLHNRQLQVKTLNALDRATQTADALDDLAVQVLNIAISGWEAEAGGLFLYDEKSQTWSCRAQYNLGQKLADPRFDLGLDMARQTLNRNTPLIIPDFEPEAHHGLRSVAAAPLVTEGQSVGALFLGANRPLALNDNHRELLATMAHQMALAIRNAQLYTQLGQMAVLEERYRLSREFHDGLAQTLGYLGLQSERLENLLKIGQVDTAVTEFAEMRRSIRAAYVDVREAIDGLRLGTESVGQLAARLSEYTTEFTRQTGLHVNFTAVPESIQVPPAAALQLLRIAQEALTNVRKHAQAEEVDVRLRQFDGELELTITDDGRGFPHAMPVDRQYRSHGLASMRERTESLGGSLTVATQPGQGTRIMVVVPVGVSIESVA